MTGPDAQRIGLDFFDRMSDRAYALDGEDRFVAFNRPCEIHYGVDRASVLGRVIWERFPALKGTDQQIWFERVRATGREETRIATSIYRPGHTVQATVFPLGAGIGVIFHDITETLEARANLEINRSALRESEEASLVGLAALNAIYDTAPVGLCVIDRDRTFIRVNARMASMYGLSLGDLAGRPVADAVPGLTASLGPVLDRIFATGEAQLDVETAGETPARPGVRRIWLNHCIPVCDASGAIVAVNVVTDDITERRTAEDRERLLVREIHHRARNLLMVVRSLVQLTWNDVPDRFLPVLDERLRSLARVHEHLAKSSWQNADLHAVIGQELAAYAAPDRIDCTGPDVRLSADAAQSVAMITHELTTNALKYGGLSVPGGRLSVAWRLEGDAVAIDWTETGAAGVAAPAREGFGSKLIRLVAGSQLKGTFEPRWDPTGFACAIRIPLMSLREET